MTKDQYKESCGRIGVPYFEHEYDEKVKDYIDSIKHMSGWDAAKEKPSLGVKFDRNKPMWSLVPPNPMEEVVEVLTYGANKYSPDNWQHVDDPDTRYFNAAMRHIWAWRQGEQFDAESHKSHLAHAVCCLLFLLAFDEDEEDDRAS
jgi:hypothetical protein